ncbi:MAG: caspase family protein [Nostoc sp. DedQUE05]|uniref:nSTAND1 domain-containing NTPase n=1 Tax=Nostoc sp. DedQUE05 TaxID=3075391 RepID=UPI002AD4987F|nr:caspase family protein [Nostoc sp. DedQUE05]MDZ8094988.1 caspase family protein [Nostoc sp. DedQUE05]
MARYALVIGIAEYVSPSLSRLSKTTNDAEAIAQLLEQYGDFQSVQRLPQRWNKEKNGYEMAASKVTGAQLGQDLRTFLLEQADNNEALIYFSGHGFTISDNLGQQKGYLASSDCQIEFKDNENVEQKYGIPLDSLNDLIQESQLSSLVMLLDCCHSGYFLERQLIERTLNAFSSQKDYYLITACRGFERAGLIKSEEYSIFTSAVVKGLAAENVGSSRRISGDRLFDFVSNELKGSVQEPIRMGWGRSITLVTHPQLDIPTEEKIAFNQENPYRGLYAFESEQAQYFCGRNEAVRTLISRLTESRFLALIGYSGSGKSSLVKAGLLPQLKGDRLPGSSQWAIASFTPGEHPLGKLVDILNRQQQQNQPQLLFIDQFEEIFTLCQDDEERQAFIRLIVQEVKTAERQTRIILTIRGDFLNKCADYVEIITLINSFPPTSFIVPIMSFTELEEAIEKPANLHGVNFEHGLVSQIFADVVNRPGALPILQYALKELWRVCIEEPESPKPLLTHEGYEEIGGVKGALDKRATILYQSLTTVDQAFARCLFMELMQLGEAGEVTRRRASWDRLDAISDSPQQLQRVVGLLAGSQQRLIITDENTIEVAHEALLSEWKLLNTWIGENLENIRLSRSLEEDCQEWVQRFNKSDDALLTGANLAVISEWVNKTQPRLTPLEAEFLHKSLERRDREVQAQLEQERQLREAAEARAKAEEEKVEQQKAKVKAERQRTQAVAVLAVISIALAGLWVKSEKNKTEVVKIGEANTWIKVSQTLLDADKQLEALMASMQALQELKKIDGKHTEKLNQLQSIIYKVREHNRLEGHQGSVYGVSLSPDSKIIASGGADGIIKIWDSNGKFLYDLTHQKEAFWRLQFSHNGKLLASASTDGTVKLWSLQANKNKLINTLSGHQGLVSDISFSHDDKLIASAGKDGIIKIWNTEVQQKQPKVENELNMRDFFLKQGNNNASEKYEIYSLDFNRYDTSKIVYGGNDGYIRVWNINKSNRLEIVGKQGEIVNVVRFSSQANVLASASSSYKGTINIWNTKITGNKPLVSFNSNNKASDNTIDGLDFSHDGHKLASGGNDETIKVWNVDRAIQSPSPREGFLLETLKGHTNGVNQLAFSHDGKTIVSSSDDGTVRLWLWHLDKRDNVAPDAEELLDYSCNFLKEYLQTNKNIPDWLFIQSGMCSISKN